MARIISPVWSQIRGSIAGTTYLSNSFHQIVARQRTNPVQPNTNYQTGIRTSFDVAEDLWEALTQAERDAWDQYAQTCVYPGPLGTYTVPGRQLFIGTLCLAQYTNALSGVGFLVDTTAPAIAGFYNPGLVQVGVYGGMTQGIALDVGIPAGEVTQIVTDVSLAFNASRLRYKGPFISADKTITPGPAGATTHIEIDRAAATAGKAIFTRTRIFTADATPNPAIPHRMSALFYLRHIGSSPP